MKLDNTLDKSLFIQIAEQLEEAIFEGVYPEGTQIPSTTEISKIYKINPATVLKGMNILVDQGLIYKKRGLGMFVSEGAKELLEEKREDLFYENYIKALVDEARKLGISKKDIMALMMRAYERDDL